jgi:hypothetical protein
MEAKQVMRWLMEGDPSIQYQVKRDLLGAKENKLSELHQRIAKEGWGKRILELRDSSTGKWGNGIYLPKWTSTHYTLLQLKDMGLPGTEAGFLESGQLLLDWTWYNKGLVAKRRKQDLCVTAMVLGICCHAGIQSSKINEIVDYVLSNQFADGGWNCEWQKEAVKSSVHTTLSVLEAFRDYEQYGYTYRLSDIKEAIPKGQEFLLRKKLFRSERNGEVIHNSMLMLSYPCRWKYDILRCLDYFQSVRLPYDPRMEEALNIILQKRRADHTWPVQQKYPGVVHFDMEKTGSSSRWNTLRVLRVLKRYRPEEYVKY